jgi:phosphopantothenate---cysteine ligase (CTP)
LKVKRAIVSSGPTREWIDPVRFISNASSGKMGFCIFQELRRWLTDVIYIHGPVQSVYIPQNAPTIYTETTEEMKEAMLANIQDDTLVIMAAAPADFKPASLSAKKIKKTSASSLSLELIPNPDILYSLKTRISNSSLQNTILVGFAAETNDLDENAMKKLHTKGLTYIMGNYVDKNTKGFGDIPSTIKIFSKDSSPIEIGPHKKEVLASEISNFLKSRIL